MNKWMSGTQAGLIATGPMTIFMVMMQNLLPEAERSPFPPASISFQVVKKLTGISPSEDAQSLLTTANHLGYGAAAGLLYSQFAGRMGRKTPLLAGAGFGVGFWAANYFGLLPTLGVRANGYRMTRKRNVMMLASHVV